MPTGMLSDEAKMVILGLGITAVVLGVSGLRANHNQRPISRALVAIALVTGVLGMGVSVMPRVCAYPAELAHRHRCASQMRQIALACQMYASDNRGRLPATLSDVLLTQQITSDEFVCPSRHDTPAIGPTTQATAANLTAGGHLSYIYAGAGLTDPAGRDVVLLYEPLANHGGAGMNVAYGDAHVEWRDAKEALWISSELAVGYNPPRPANAAPAVTPVPSASTLPASPSAPLSPSGG